MPAIITAIISALSQLGLSFTQEQSQKLSLILAEQQAIADLLKAQATIDTTEAQSPNLFVAGWRPMIGWICALSFAWSYFLYPIITYITVVSGHPLPNLPTLNNSDVTTVMMGMLGLGFGTARTVEKLNGVSHLH